MLDGIYLYIYLRSLVLKEHRQSDANSDIMDDNIYFFQKSITLKLPRWNVFAGGDVGALKLDAVLPSRGEGDVVYLI